MQAFSCSNMQRIGNAEMIPQNLVQGGMFINPQDFLDGNDSGAVTGKNNKIMFCDKHILCGKLR